MVKYQTEQRKILVDFFKESNHRALSAQDIHRELASTNISVSAIYRNLADMEKQNIVCRISEENRTGALYQYVDPNCCIGVIHLKCQSCQATFHLNKHISQMVIELARESHNFSINSFAAFLYGKCDNCSQIPAI